MERELGSNKRKAAIFGCIFKFLMQEILINKTAVIVEIILWFNFKCVRSVQLFFAESCQAKWHRHDVTLHAV